jgi:hypothetical protein
MSSPQESFAALTLACRRATEALSQAETACSDFAASARRAVVVVPGASAAAAGASELAAITARVEAACAACTASCSEARQSPLWGAGIDTLQALSGLQRQRLESLRNDLADMERQVRVLASRHAMNVEKRKLASSVAAASPSSSTLSASSSPSSALRASGAAGRGVSSANDDADAEEAALRSSERQSLVRAVGGVRQLVSESNAVLDALRTQRQRVLETEFRLDKVLMSAGVAASVVQQIERLTTVDRALVFGGICGLTLFMGYLWFFA